MDTFSEVEDLLLCISYAQSRFHLILSDTNAPAYGVDTGLGHCRSLLSSTD